MAREFSRRTALRFGIGGAAGLALGSAGVVSTGQVAAASSPRFAAADVAQPAGATPVWKPFQLGYGFNEQNIQGPLLSDPDLIQITSDYQMKLWRYPGGTNSNFWDWQRGWLVELNELPNIPPAQGFNKPNLATANFPWKLEDLKAFRDITGITPLFVPNLITRTLEDQLDMLRHARDIGLPVEYIELGNEFYLNGYINGPASIADGAAYGATAVTWAEAIRDEFPDAKIAAVAWDGNEIFTAGQRQLDWNTQMLPYLQATDAIDAVTTHPYAFINYLQNVYGEAMDLTEINRNRIIATAFDPTRDAARVMTDDLPLDLDVWFTEFNITDLKYWVAASRWLQAIWIAAAHVEIVKSPNVTVATIHALAGAMTFTANHHPAYEANFLARYGVPMTVWGKAAVGVPASDLFEVMNDATEFSELDFGNVPDISVEVAGVTKTFPSLVGLAFHANSETRAVIVNLTNDPSTVDLQGLGLTGDWTMRTAPYDQLIADADTDVTTTTGLVGTAVQLAGYSITTVRGTTQGGTPPAGGGSTSTTDGGSGSTSTSDGATSTASEVASAASKTPLLAATGSETVPVGIAGAAVGAAGAILVGTAARKGGQQNTTAD